MSRASLAATLAVLFAVSWSASGQIPHFDAGCRLPVVVAADRTMTDEAGGLATFQIAFPCPVHTDNMVVVFTLEGTAAAGVDYTHDAGFWPAAGMHYVLFAPFETAKNVTITGLDDSDVEGPETVALQLHPPAFYFGPDRYFLLPPTDRATVTLVDSEVPACWGPPNLPAVPPTGLERMVATQPGPAVEVETAL